MEIYVQAQALKNSALEIKDIAQQIEYAENKLKHIGNSLDWNVKSKATVSKSFLQLHGILDGIEQTLERHRNFLIDTANTYKGLDAETQNETENFKKDLYSDSKENKTDSGSLKGTQSTGGYKDELKFIKDIVKQLGDLYSKYVIGKSGMNGCSFVYGSILKTIDLIFSGADLYQKYKNGSLADPVDWVLNLSKFGNTMLKAGTGIYYSYKNYKNGLQGIAKIYTKAEVLKKQIWGKITGKGTDAAITTQGIRKSKINNTLMLLGIALDTGIQGKKSWDKYSADGVVDNKELGAIGIEASTKGLFSVVENGLMVTGIGIPLGLGLSYLDSKNDWSGKISEGLENWAEDAGRSVGKNGISSKKGAEGVAITTFYHIGKGATGVVEGTKKVVKKVGEVVGGAKSWLADKLGW